MNHQGISKASPCTNVKDSNWWSSIDHFDACASTKTTHSSPDSCQPTCNTYRLRHRSFSCPTALHVSCRWSSSRGLFLFMPGGVHGSLFGTTVVPNWYEALLSIACSWPCLCTTPGFLLASWIIAFANSSVWRRQTKLRSSAVTWIRSPRTANGTSASLCLKLARFVITRTIQR